MSFRVVHNHRKSREIDQINTYCISPPTHASFTEHSDNNNKAWRHWRCGPPINKTHYQYFWGDFLQCNYPILWPLLRNSINRDTQSILIQQTWYIAPMLVYCWASVVDGGPTLNQHWVDVFSGQSKVVHHPDITGYLLDQRCVHVATASEVAKQCKAPTFKAPTLKASTFKAPTLKASTFEAPTLKASTFRAPTLKASTFRAPTLKASTFKAPTLKA